MKCTCEVTHLEKTSISFAYHQREERRRMVAVPLDRTHDIKAGQKP